MRILLARQPIFDLAHHVVGYEVFCADGDQRATSDEVLVDALVGTGFDQLRHGRPAFLPITAGLLLRAGGLLQPERMVLQVQPDGDVAGPGTCAELRQAGFGIVLDHYTGSPREAAYLDVVDTVKIDIRGFQPIALQRHAEQLRARGLHLLADKVERQSDYERCRQLGFTLFQGYHFSRPEVVERRDLSVQHIRTFRLMRMVRNLSITDHAVEQEFQADAALAYKLLRIVNTATVGAVGVRSIGHAIRLLGRDQLYRWLALLLVTRCHDQRLELEIMRAALLRARFCEQLTLHEGAHGISGGSAYMIGLLSALEPYLALDARATVRELELAAEPAAALIDRSGPLGRLLSLAESYERGEFPEVLRIAGIMGMHPSQIVACYLDAIAFVSTNAPEIAA